MCSNDDEMNLEEHNLYFMIVAVALPQSWLSRINNIFNLTLLIKENFNSIHKLFAYLAIDNENISIHSEFHGWLI